MSLNVVGTRSDDELIDDAFNRAFEHGPSNFVRQEKAGKGERTFILKTNGYYDIQAYVFVGLTLPASHEDFDVLYPEKKMQDLHNLDPTIYAKTKTTLVKVYQQCKEFNDKNMASWILVSQEVIKFADEFKSQMNDLGLAEALDTLADEKYEDDDSHDKKFKDALSTAQASFEDLSGNAGSSEKKIAEIIKAVVGFTSSVAQFKGEVDYLDKQYNIGPPLDENQEPRKLPDGKDMKPYTEELEGKLAQARKDVWMYWERYRKEVEIHKDAVLRSATTPSYCWLGLVGLVAAGIVAGVYGDKAVKSKQAFEKAMADAQREAKHVSALSHLITLVQIIKSQSELIAKLQEHAINALKELKDLFSEMKMDLGKVVSQYSAADKRLVRTLVHRKRARKLIVEQTVPLWEEIRKLAKEFISSSAFTIKEIDDQKAGKIDQNAPFDQKMLAMEDAFKPCTDPKLLSTAAAIKAALAA